MITGFNDNDDMMLVVELVVFVVNLVMNNMRFRVMKTVKTISTNQGVGHTVH